MKPDEEMDLTVYLQTEGRRRAAELAAAASNPASAVSKPARQPESLSEFLQCMGLAPLPAPPDSRMKPPRQL
jgi:hypothetical protein